jgi:hypothetical protein
MLRARLWPLAAFLVLAPAFAHSQCVKKPKPVPAAAQPADRDKDPETYFRTFPYTKKVLDAKDLAALNADYGELQGGMAEYARVVIFANHGRVFRDPVVANFLSSEKWYKANPNFSNTLLNATERQNLDMVRGVEAHQHPHVMPGDLRYWMNREFTAGDLADSTLVELHIMHAEIEAIHGKRFDDEPLIQKYFNERYWYKPTAHYDPKELTGADRANLELLAHMEAVKRGNALTPGSMLAYGEKPIKPELIVGLNLYQLRLLRNEIYAIRGGMFHTQWIQDYFDGQDWYTPLPKGKQPELTSLDERNVALIIKRENLLHQALSTTRLKDADLKGMLSDDAGRLRNEIYARRGKVFKNKWLQSYFTSMAWYKPDLSYTDKLLSPIERQNVQILAKYEKKATAQEDMTEG